MELEVTLTCIGWARGDTAAQAEPEEIVDLNSSQGAMTIQYSCASLFSQALVQGDRDKKAACDSRDEES